MIWCCSNAGLKNWPDALSIFILQEKSRSGFLEGAQYQQFIYRTGNSPGSENPFLTRVPYAAEDLPFPVSGNSGG